MGILGYITFPDQDSASNAGAALVDARLACGVNIHGPVKSIYRWQGEVRAKEEWQMFLQSKPEDSDRIREMIVAMHPYEVPCIIFLNIADGHPPFLKWIEMRGE